MTGSPSAIDWAALAGLWTLVGAGYVDSRRRVVAGDGSPKPPFMYDGNQLRPWVVRAMATIGVIPAGIAIVVDAQGKLWWVLLSVPLAVVVGVTVSVLYGMSWYARALAAPEERGSVWAVAAVFALALAAIPVVVGVVGLQKHWALATALALNYLIVRIFLFIARRQTADTGESSS